MDTKEAKKLLESINQVRYPKRVNNNSHTHKPFKPRKRRNESDRDYIFRLNGFRCRYTNRKLPKHKLSLITLYPNKTDIPKWENLGCAWTDYALMKGSMDDLEFRKFLAGKKKEIRQEAYEYSNEIKKAVFERNQYKCIYCEYEYGMTPADRKLTIDHKLPVSKGGTNDLERNFKNLTCACEQHNFEKRDRTAAEYFRFLEKRKHNQQAH